MAKYLLDTQYYLWWLNDDPQLNNSVRKLIADADNIILASVANIWEISIKMKVGKLPLKTNLATIIDSTDFNFLDIKPSHILKLDTLPLHHQDPFDRILISQALVDKCTLVTTDSNIKKYDVPIFG